MSKELESHLDLLDQKIRHGDIKFVQNELDGLELERVPNRYAARIASLARRVSRGSLGVDILYPIVRPRDSKKAKATGEDIAEYAALLTYLGSWREALGLLKKLNPEEFPQVWLYQAFGFFAHWDYKGAIEPLQKYITSKTLSDYERLVGQLNLAAAWVNEKKYDDARELLQLVIREARKESYKTILANALERSAELSIGLKHWKTAETLLLEAESLISEKNNLYNLFIRKWMVFLNILSEGYPEHYQIKLKNLRAEAQQLQHWETVRDCDRFEAVVTQNKKLLLKVYFGTPHENFRQKLIREFKSTVVIPEFYVWGSELTEIDSSPLTLDVSEGVLKTRNSEGIISLTGKTLAKDSLSFRLLSVLSSDFYSPFGDRYLFAQLYPKENYQPKSSKEKVCVVVQELRNWFHQNGVPLIITEKNGFFKQEIVGPLLMKVGLKRNET